MRIAILSLVPDPGHTISLLDLGKLLQDNGFEVSFFGSSENNSLCQQRNVPFSTFEIERPLNYDEYLARFAQATRFWNEAIITKWIYINYFQKVDYYGIRLIPKMYKIVHDFKPDAVLGDSHEFLPSFELIALKLNCPIICNVAYGSYYTYQSSNHISSPPINPFLKAFLPPLKKILRKSLSEFYKLFKKNKFFYDEYINNYLNEYWSSYFKTDFSKLRKLTISSGTGILERKYLVDRITISENVFQVGPIAYTYPNLLNEDLSNWLKQDSKPVIYVSFGSMIKGKFPFFEAVVKAAISEGYRVLWSYNVKPWKDSLDSADLRWERWVPQVNILAHKNVTLFLSHCGAGAVKQALWFSKPIVCIPLLWDQFYNSWILEQLCGAPLLNKNAITIKSVKSGIKAAVANQEKFNNISAEFKANEGSKLIIERIMEFLNV